jgi:hypothetical protein
MTLLKASTDFATHKLDLLCVSSIILLVTSMVVYWWQEIEILDVTDLDPTYPLISSLTVRAMRKQVVPVRTRLRIWSLIVKNNLPRMTDIETSHDLSEYSNNSVLINTLRTGNLII